MQFPFDQSLLMPTKMQASMNMYQQMLQTLAAPEMMKTQRETAQQDLLAKKQSNQYYPQSTQADIDYKNAQVPYLGAQTAQTQAQTAAMPIDQIIKEQMAFNDAGKLAQSQSRFNQVQALSSYLKSNVGQSQFANDKPFAAAATRMMSGLASDDDYQAVAKKMGGQGAYQGNLIQNLLPNFAKTVGYQVPPNGQSSQAGPQPVMAPQNPQQAAMPSPSLNPQQVQQLQNANPNLAAQLGITAPPGPTNLQPPQSPPRNQSAPVPAATIQAPINEAQPAADMMNQGLKTANLDSDHHNEVVDNMQKNMSDLMEKRSSTTSTLNQRTAANTLRNLMDKIQDYLPSIYKYTGFKGHLNLTWDKLLASTGLYTSPDLIKYNAFEKTIKPGTAGDLRNQLKGQATDQEINQMMDVVDPSTSWFGNKQIAQGQMQGLEQLMQSADKSLVQNPTDARSSLVNQQPIMDQQGMAKQQGTSQQQKSFDEKTVDGRLMRRLPGKSWVYVDEIP